MLKDLPLRIIELFQSLGTFEAYALILLVLLGCGFGIPIPEDVTLISAGIISASGTISLEGALIAGFLGVLAGDSFLFFLGRRFGKKVFTWPVFNKLFTPERVLIAESRIRKNGKYICFVARFMPGLRAPIYLSAGTMGVKRKTFFLADGFAALISVPVWVVLGHWFGHNIDLVLSTAKRINSVLVIVLLAAVIGYLIYRKIRKQTPNSII